MASPVKAPTGLNPMPANRVPLTARRNGPLSGAARVPGDKSISIRALILGALTVGETRIGGLLEGEDVLKTAKALQALGARIERTGERQWLIHGVGVGGFAEPGDALDFGNSGTGCRLALGAVAGCPITATFDGDASLRSRPMRRVLDPLQRIGARTLSLGGRPLAADACRRARSDPDRVRAAGRLGAVKVGDAAWPALRRPARPWSSKRSRRAITPRRCSCISAPRCGSSRRRKRHAAASRLPASRS